MPVTAVYEDPDDLDAHGYPRDPLEFDALAARALAKIRVVVARYGMNEEQFAEMFLRAPDDVKKSITEEINAVVVDPRTGGGLS